MHAIVEFSLEYPNHYYNWKVNSNYLCCLELEKNRFDYLLSQLDLLKIRYSVFFEPDIGNELTAIAVEALNDSTHKLLFKKLKLANHGK